VSDWTDIPDTAIVPGKPVLASHGVAYRDNPVAIAEGAVGAPRIEGQQGPVVKRGGLFLGQGSISGTLAVAAMPGPGVAGEAVVIVMNRTSFFPAIGAADGLIMQASLAVPGANPAGRFRLVNYGDTNRDYSVAWEFITS
jgi:hypothetical protein